jgi:hypothetical protein
MFEATVWERKKLVTIWENADLIITQESETITKTTVVFKEKRELLDKSINESKNNILKCVLLIRVACLLLASTICILFLRIIRPLFYILLAIVKSLFYIILVIVKFLFYIILNIAKFLFYIILNIAKFLFFYIIKPIATWLITMVASFSKSMCESINSLFVEIKSVGVKHAAKKPLQLQIKLHQLIVPIVFSLLFVWIFAYSY